MVIEINPQLRIPRTFKRFSGLIAQLLSKYKIRGERSSEFLLKVIKAPVESHFPVGCPRIGLSVGGKLVNIDKYVEEKFPENETVVLAIGAVAKGDPGKEAPYVEEVIAISGYSLSAACCCFKVTNAFEKKWGIL